MKELIEMQESIQDEEIFVPMVSHNVAPTPMPVAGDASRTREHAEARVREMLATPHFSKGWVVSKLDIIEIQ